MSSLSPTSGRLCCKEPSWYAISCCWIPPNPADDYPIQCLSEHWHNQSAIRRLPHRLVTQSWLADVLEWPLMSSWQSGLALHVVSHSFFVWLPKVERSAFIFFYFYKHIQAQWESKDLGLLIYHCLKTILTILPNDTNKSLPIFPFINCLIFTL